MAHCYQKLVNPKVSIVICNYNYEKYIAHAISSAINQTHQPTEIIVVDDGSVDNSVEVIQSFSTQVKLVKKNNGGQVSAYNEGINHVTGDVVIFLDADDELLPNALDEIADKFYENIVKVHYLMRVINKDGDDLNTILPSVLDSGDCGKNLIKHGLMYKSPPASGNAYRVEALQKIFPLPTLTEEKHGADYFCIYGICLLGNIASINKPLFNYRIQDTSDNISNRLGFGNAIKQHDRLKMSLRRWKMLSQWVFDNSDGSIILPKVFIDFTQQKHFLALDVVNSNSIHDRFLVIKRHLLWILQSIYLRGDLNIFKKLGLVFWVFLVVMLPKKVSVNLARLVCNPIAKYGVKESFGCSK